MLLVTFLSLTSVHDSLVHLYIPQLFTHGLSTIICVMQIIFMQAYMI